MSQSHKPRVTLSRAACHTRAMSTLIDIRLSVKGYRKIVTQTWVQVTLTPIDRRHCTRRLDVSVDGDFDRDVVIRGSIPRSLPVSQDDCHSVSIDT